MNAFDSLKKGVTRREWWGLLAIFLLMLVFYNIASGKKFLEQSLAPHYIYLAEAFLQGQVNIRDMGNPYDLIHYQDKWYLASPPMPGVLFMPFVALFTTEFSDVLFSTLLGATNVILVYLVFRNRWLALLLALGTPHLYFSFLGSIWFQAQSTAILFSLLAIGTALQKRPALLVGFFWGCAILARPTLLFGSPFLFYFVIKVCERPYRQMISLFLPIFVSVGLLGAYNAARFGSPADFGYAYMSSAPNIVRTIKQYGSLNPHFLWCNLHTSLFALPIFYGVPPTTSMKACAYLIEGVTLTFSTEPVQLNPFGMSLFAATPAFLLLFGTFTHQRKDRYFILTCWMGLLLTMLPNWLLHNTGSFQFGYRYWLDAAPIWLCLLAWVWQYRWASRLGRWLILLSVAINLWGAMWMYGHFVGW